MSLEVFTGDHLPALLTRIRESLGPEAVVVQLRRVGAQFELIASASNATPGAATTSSVVAAPTEPDFRDVFRAEMAREVPAPKRAAPAKPEPVSAQSHVPPASRWAPPPRDEQPVARIEPVAVRDPIVREVVREQPRSATPVAAQSAPRPPRPSFMPRPWVVALVGPTGAGKTTTIAKLATNPLAFGSCRVGLIGLDTYRVGAVEQLETYADIADLPIEIAYSEADVSRAVARLNECEVVLVDTPGRGPRNVDDTETIRKWLAILAPDEVHLALPAGQLSAVTRRLLRSYDAFGITHLLATKLDEYPHESTIFTIAHENGRRMRWVTDGQEVPTDIRPAAELIAAVLARREGGMMLESVA